MDYDVIEARYVGRYVIWLRFRDNTSGEIDLEKQLYGPVFQPLRQQAAEISFAPAAGGHRHQEVPDLLQWLETAAKAASSAAGRLPMGRSMA